MSNTKYMFKDHISWPSVERNIARMCGSKCVEGLAQIAVWERLPSDHGWYLGPDTSYLCDLRVKLLNAKALFKCR